MSDEEPRQDETDLRLRSARGFAWKAVGLLAAQPLSFATTIVLARLLTPADFGLVAMAGLFVGLASLVNEFGLTSALVQRRDLSDDEIQSVFWFNLTLGGVMVLAGVALSHPLAAFFGQPLLAWILPVSSLSFLISSFALIPSALFARHMEFRRPAIGGVWAAAATLVSAAGLALLGAGVWAMVVGGLVGTLTLTAYLVGYSGWRPRAHFRWSEARPLAGFGGVLMAATLVNWGSWNVDYLLVGRVLGSAPLGTYTLAFNLTSIPTRKLSGTVVATFLPAFSRVPDHFVRFRSAYIDGLAFTSLPSAVVLATTAVLSQEVILGLYGAEWSGAVAPLRVLCAAGFLTSVTTLTGLVFRGLGRPGRELRWSIALLAGSAVGVLAGLPYGIAGVAVGLTLGMLVSRIPAQAAANRMLEIGAKEFGRSLLPALAAAAVAVAIAAGLRYLLLLLDAPPLLRLVVAGPTAVCGAWAIVRATRLGAPARAMEHLFANLLRVWRAGRAEGGATSA